MKADDFLLTKPDKDTIAAWLMTTGHPVLRANAWATFLEGLRWGDIRPLVSITVDAHLAHPRVALQEAMKASSDKAFKARGRRHLAKWEEKP